MVMMLLVLEQDGMERCVGVGVGVGDNYGDGDFDGAVSFGHYLSVFALTVVHLDS